MAPLRCVWLVEGSIAAQAELKCWWMPHPLAGLKRAFLGWQHPGGEFSNTKTERKRQKTKKEQFLILKRKIILRYLQSHKLVKNQSLSKSAAL